MNTIEKILSPTNYPYETIIITKSRIDKALLVIPKSFARKWFPTQNTPINVYFDDSEIIQIKNYVSYLSSTTEARVMGLTEWIRENEIKQGDEIIIQVIDKENLTYRIMTEKLYLKLSQELNEDVERTENIDDVYNKISNINVIDKTEVYKREFNRYAYILKEKPRERIRRSEIEVKETVPSYLRKLLENIYNGKCQVCNFGFLKKDETPYYEIHHIHDNIGNNLQNLLLVCPNCHCQFTYTNVKLLYNKDWISEVFFNNEHHTIQQFLLSNKVDDAYKIVHY